MSLTFTMHLDFPTERRMRRIVDEVSYEQAGQLESRLEAAWPVDTGRSRRAWGRTGVGADWLVVNGTPYAAYVRPAGADEPLAESLIPRQLQITADDIAEELAERLPASMLSEAENG